MTKTADFDHGAFSASSNGSAAEFPCAGEDLKHVLVALTRQIEHADERNAVALDDMRQRLEQLGREAGAVRERAPGELSSAFGRIKDGVQMLAGRVSSVSRELGATKLQPGTAPVAPQGHFDPVLAVSAPRAASANQSSTASRSVPGDAMSPWDQDSAEALTRVYEQPQASNRDRAVAMTETAPSHDSGPSTPTYATAPIQALSPAAPYADREWLEGRFANIAARIEQSFSEPRSNDQFAAFDARLGLLETHFGAALQDVATRADVEGLRIVEAHVHELTEQFERAHLQLGRLDQVEAQLGDLLHKVSDERFASLIAQVGAAAGAGFGSHDLNHVAASVAEQVASRLSQQSADAALREPELANPELRQLIEGFVAGQRDVEEHTSSMLDTMQQAMIRMLDRMDALENTAPAYHAQQPAFAPPPAAPGPQLRMEPLSANPIDAAATMSTAPVAEPPKVAAVPQASSASEDFRTAAVAEARRAARRVASLTSEQTSVADNDLIRSRRNASAVRPGLDAGELTAASSEPAAEKRPKSRVPLMVAGVALAAAVGLLAVSVGMGRGVPFLSGSGLRQAAQAKLPLAVDTGSQETEGGMKSGAEAQGQQSGTNTAPAKTVPMSDGAATDLATGQQEASAPAVAAGLPEGMTITKARAVPNDSDLARMRQQRNMASLANQLAAVQANAPTVPASLIPNGGADADSSETAGKAVDLPPAMIGPLSLRTAAAKGDPSAEFEVAARFAEGRGIGQDFKQAIVWYQRSAQRGFAPAQYRLGTLFERGIGTKADIARAKVWYGRAAEQGHVKAMHNLAVLTSGNTQSADYPVAVQWYTAAAEYGLADSQFNLGVLYDSGLGMQKDIKKAYLWLALAARTGDKEALRRSQQIRGKLDEPDAAAVDEVVAAWRAKPVDSSINDPRVAGEGWKARQSVGR